jgi:glutaredoxin 3
MSNFICIKRENCNYCNMAMDFLNKLNIDYNIIILDDNNKDRIYSEIDKYTNNYRKYPMIFLNNRFIGGYTDLMNLNNQIYSKIPDISKISGVNINKIFNNNNTETTKFDGSLNIIIPTGDGNTETTKFDGSPKIIIPTGDGNTESTKFDGSPWLSVIAMYYLSFKHKNDCVVNPRNINDRRPVQQTEISMRWDEKKKKLRVPKHFWKYFNKCQGTKRFIVLPFGYTCKNISHANYLIYDSKTKCLERFEPNGNVTKLVHNKSKDKDCLLFDVDKEIKKLITEKMGKDFIKEYYKPIDYLPDLCVQALQELEITEMKSTDPVGFCAAWSAWYTDLRLSNPDIDRKTLINYAINNIKSYSDSFTSFIRNYSEYLYKLAKKLNKTNSLKQTFENF